jgi:hypothetical protein
VSLTAELEPHRVEPDSDASPNAEPACPDQDAPASWAPTPRQRHRLDWTPLSLHHPDRTPPDSLPSLPLPRARHILTARLGVRMPATVLSGTARGNECVSRTWGSRKPSHPHATTARCLMDVAEEPL